jgi:hypothetical protein
MFTDEPFFLTSVVIIAMIPLYILILKRLRPSPTLTKTITVNNTNKVSLKTRKKGIVSQKKPAKNGLPRKLEHSCNHDFGYLQTIPKKAAIPNECLSCPKIVECLRQE